MTGTVKMVNHQKGWGFIRTTEAGDIFFHRSTVRGQPWEFVEEAQVCDVELGQGQAGKGPRAITVWFA